MKNDVEFIAHKAKRHCDLVPDHLSGSTDMARCNIGEAIEVTKIIPVRKIQEKLVLWRASCKVDRYVSRIDSNTAFFVKGPKHYSYSHESYSLLRRYPSR
jgi:hypothetical protein